MANATIYDLTAKTAPAVTDEFELQETADGDSKKMTYANLFKFPEAHDIVLGTTTGTKIGTDTAQKLAFWNSTPVVQQVLATGGGATVDDVITLLQTLGLCKQA